LLSFIRAITQKNAIPVLDGVRAIACLSVISYHVHYLVKNYNMPGVMGALPYSLVMSGWSGVTLFFVLSGFLLFLPYAKSLLFAETWPSARTFYLRRALRILPGYYVALALLILFTHPEYLQADHLKALALFLTFLMDAPSTYQQINGPFWTLAIEWQYYMLLPLLAWGFSWLVRRGKSDRQRLWLVISCLLGMILWGLGTRYLGRYYSMHPGETLLVPRPILNAILLVVYGTDGKYFEDFALGMLVSTLFIFTRRAAQDHKISAFLYRHNIWFWGAGVALLFFMAAWSTYYAQLIFLQPFIGAHSWLTELGYALGFALCITAILFGSPALKALFSWEPLRWIGTLSYSLYIWHLPILHFFRDTVINPLTQRLSWTYLLYWICVLFLIIPCSFLFYRYIELPWIQMAHTTRKKEHLLLNKETQADFPVPERDQDSVTHRLSQSRSMLPGGAIRAAAMPPAGRRE